jgi:hypothetical protein
MLVRNDESYSTLDDEPAGKFAEGRPGTSA